MTSVSYIIPAHNEEKYIANCVNSINQAMHYHPKVDYEIIVVDNGSTDETWLKAAAENVRVVFEPQKGVSAARIKGFNESKYELCAFLDADDKLPLQWLDIALDTLSDKDIIAVSGPLQFYDTPQYVNTLAKNFHVLARFFHKWYPTLQGGNYMVRREALSKASQAFNSLYDFWGEDTWTAVQLSKVGKIELNPYMIMETSGRRLIQDGMIKTTGLYILNYFAINILHHPLTHKYSNFR